MQGCTNGTVLVSLMWGSPALITDLKEIRTKYMPDNMSSLDYNKICLSYDTKIWKLYCLFAKSKRRLLAEGKLSKEDS